MNNHEKYAELIATLDGVIKAGDAYRDAMIPLGGNILKVGLERTTHITAEAVAAVMDYTETMRQIRGSFPDTLQEITDAWISKHSQSSREHNHG